MDVSYIVYKNIIDYEGKITIDARYGQMNSNVLQDFAQPGIEVQKFRCPVQNQPRYIKGLKFLFRYVLLLYHSLALSIVKIFLIYLLD